MTEREMAYLEMERWAEHKAAALRKRLNAPGRPVCERPEDEQRARLEMSIQYEVFRAVLRRCINVRTGRTKARALVREDQR